MTDGNEVVSQVVISGLIGYSLEFLKQTRWFPWLTYETRRANRTVAWIVALLAAIGIHFQFDAQAGQLVITGLTLAGITHGAWEYAKQLVIQEMVYRASVKDKEAKESL